MKAVNTSISDCTIPVRNIDPRQWDGEFTYIDISSIDRSTKEIVGAKVLATSDAPSRARKEIEKDDVLVSTVRPNLNAVAIVEEKPPRAIGSTGFSVLRADTNKLNPRYLFYRAISEPFINDMMAQAKGAGYPAVSDRIVGAHKFLLPSLKEQAHIVEILDHADSLRKMRSKADELSHRIIPAIFHEMFAGETYVTALLGEITTKIGSGATPRGGSKVYTDSGPILLRSQNIHQLSLDLSDVAHIPKDAYEALARVMVNKGDVLLNITGASIGRVTPVVDKIKEAVVNQHVCIIRPQKNRLNYLYLAFLLSTPKFQHMINASSSGAAQAGFNHEKTKTLEIPLPPTELQESFANRYLEALSTKSNQLSSHNNIQRLFDTLLHKAFNGSLTAKWREGEGKELIQEMEHQAKS